MFERHVGIFYRTQLYKQDMHNHIVDKIGRNRFLKFSKNELWGDNFTITFVPANTSARGYKFTDIFFEDGIDKSIINSIILPTKYDDLHNLMWYLNNYTVEPYRDDAYLSKKIGLIKRIKKWFRR